MDIQGFGIDLCYDRKFIKMYTTHSSFIQPENENVKIWRYMDFSKFMSMIHEKSLHFSSPDKFEDIFEGSWPKSNIELRNERPDAETEEKREALFQAFGGEIEPYSKILKKYIAIYCWHENDHESAAMWSLYLKTNEGIAIQSTFRRLRESTGGSKKIHFSRVKYIDYNKDQIKADKFWEPFLHKRRSFEHEKELRAFIMDVPPYDWRDETNPGFKNGWNADVDLLELIEKVYIAPNAPSWFSNLVKSVLVKYGLPIEVLQSSLNEDPLF